MKKVVDTARVSWINIYARLLGDVSKETCELKVIRKQQI